MPSSARNSLFCTSSSFTLPHDWSVVEKQRCSGASAGQVDKYYIEPGTGRMFRSLVTVQKYLSEGKIDAPKTNKSTAVNKNSMQIIPYTARNISSFILPDDWIIERKKRRSSGVIDKYYIEPGSGRRFRSLISVERYLTEAGADEMPLKALKYDYKINEKNISVKKCSLQDVVKTVKPCNHSRLLKHSGTLTKHHAGEDVQGLMTCFSCKPSKVNWVLSGSEGNMWSPFMDDYMVPESVKHKWSETFISYIYKGSLNGPNL